MSTLYLRDFSFPSIRQDGFDLQFPVWGLEGPLNVPVRLNAGVFRATEKCLPVVGVLDRDEESSAGTAWGIRSDRYSLKRERVVASRIVRASVEFAILAVFHPA